MWSAGRRESLAPLHHWLSGSQSSNRWHPCLKSRDPKQDMCLKHMNNWMFAVRVTLSVILYLITLCIVDSMCIVQRFQCTACIMLFNSDLCTTMADYRNCFYGRVAFSVKPRGSSFMSINFIWKAWKPVNCMADIDEQWTENNKLIQWIN